MVWIRNGDNFFCPLLTYSGNPLYFYNAHTNKLGMQFFYPIIERPLYCGPL